MQKFAYRSVKLLYMLLMAAIMGVLLLFSQGKYFGIYCNYPIRNPVLVAVGLLLSAVGYGLVYGSRRKLSKNKDLPYDRWVKTVAVSLFIFQVYVSYNIVIYPGWDAGGVLREAGIIVYRYRDLYQDMMNRGYSRYPNNLLLLVVDTALVWFNRYFGFFTGEQTQMCISVVTCLINTATCVTVYKTAGLFLRKPYAFGAFLVSVVSIGLNPWFSFCYTDSFGILFPILVFYLYWKPAGKSPAITRALAMVLGAVGYRFKPQCVIMVIALLLREFVLCFGSQWKSRLKQLAIDLGVLAVTLAVLSSAIGMFCDRFDIVIDKEQTFGPAHWFMMGLNEGTEGVYAQEDVDFSGSFATGAQRNAADLERAMERIKAFGPVGLAKHTIRKIRRVYDDGTFGWEIGSAYSIPKHINKAASSFLRSFYYDNSEGTRYEYFGKLEQFTWVMILLYSLASAPRRPKEMGSGQHFVLLLAIVGLILFELLFEAHPRYVYTSVPIFIVLGATGAQNIGDALLGRSAAKQPK